MSITEVLLMLAAAATGAGLGVTCYRVWLTRAALNLQRIPEQWHLQARPLFTVTERIVWHWLKRVFFDHHVLLKMPVIRFLLPLGATKGQHSYELLKGVYCTFTICTADGKVVGCLDVPGKAGLKASNRDLKKHFFDECGVAYAVLNASQLPTLEALRAAFLGDTALARPVGNEFAPTSQMPFSQPADIDSTPASGAPRVPLPANNVQSDGSVPYSTDMLVVAAARSSLQSKLDRNRKIRLAKIDELNASMGIVDDSTDRKFAPSWDDSFIANGEPRNSDSSKR